MKIYMFPQKGQWPKSGGVREHLRVLTKFFKNDSEIKLVHNPYEADLYHIESAYKLPSNLPPKPKVYVCHGGFVPQPIPQVLHNLYDADLIITVAQWLADQYFPQLTFKTMHIPNGIDFEEYTLNSIQPIEPSGYILYGKDYVYNPAPYVQAVVSMRDLRFLSVVPQPIPIDFQAYNFQSTGRLTKAMMNRLIKSAGCLVMTGSEVCPTMVLEAWACGTPVVALGIDGNKELMLDTKTNRTIGGALFGVKTNIVEAIRYVLKNRDKLGAEGRKQAEMYYDMADIVTKYKYAYKRLLK